jgi:hypothetical protein
MTQNKMVKPVTRKYQEQMEELAINWKGKTKEIGEFLSVDPCKTEKMQEDKEKIQTGPYTILNKAHSIWTHSHIVKYCKVLPYHSTQCKILLLEFFAEDEKCI